MLAGEAMRGALAEIEPDLARERLTAGAGEGKGRIVMATVQGDVHDIGKNLVALMLRNHGYEVFDLGKDVPAEAIIEAVRSHSPDIIGLSALMTTTLAAMRDTIAAVRAAGVGDVKFMVGGAAVTEHFAKEAGADGFSADAVAAVKLAGRLMEGGA
jgi:5-methyltetrahydrofolate--homocysteine methyltransferase